MEVLFLGGGDATRDPSLHETDEDTNWRAVGVVAAVSLDDVGRHPATAQATPTSTGCSPTSSRRRGGTQGTRISCGNYSKSWARGVRER